MPQAAQYTVAAFVLLAAAGLARWAGRRQGSDRTFAFTVAGIAAALVLGWWIATSPVELVACVACTKDAPERCARSTQALEFTSHGEAGARTSAWRALCRGLFSRDRDRAEACQLQTPDAEFQCQRWVTRRVGQESSGP